MATCLQPEERIVVCDAFESDTEDHYVNKPSPETLISNIIRLRPDIEKNRIIIHKCLSSDLHIDLDQKFRFIHLDGGHAAEQVYFDLDLCGKHLLPAGIMVVDDFHNKHWPGVTQGTDRFLSDRKEFRVLADLNRHGAFGRKLYLIKTNRVT